MQEIFPTKLATKARKANGDAYLVEQRKILRGYFQDVLDVVAGQPENIKLDELLQRQGITRNDIVNASPRLTFDAYFHLLGAIQETGKIPGIGLQLGIKKTVQCFGIYGYALLSSTTLAAFSAVAERIFRAIYDVLEISHDVRGDRLEISYSPLMRPRMGYVSLMEQVVGCGVALMGSLLPPGLDWGRCEVRCNYPPPDYADLYAHYLPGKIVFNAPLTQLCLPAKWLQMELVAGDAFIAHACESKFSEILDGISGSGSMADRIRRILLSSNFNRLPSLPEMAQRFCISERALRYHLADEGASFRDLVTEVRISLAKRYLHETDLSIQEMAYSLGYAHVQNFYRAFGKETGITPEEFRRYQG